jgi:two-component system response regulator CpxR
VRILVVDDDVELCELLGQFLRQEDIGFSFAHDGPTGLRMALSGDAELVILDVMLPGIDGFEVLRRLRRESRVPILMLTARGEDVDRIVGLELGADDYLPKPFNPRELAARIRAILRRTTHREQAAAGDRVEVGGIALDPSTREVRRQGEPVELTTIEFDILEALLRAAGRVMTRDHLMEQIYDRKATPFDRAVDMHISHIRKKLGGSRPIIKTVRGVGYQFVKEEEPAS